MGMIKYKCKELLQSIIRTREEVKRMEIEDLNNLPFFKNSISKDYVTPELSEFEKERINGICRWLFPELYDKNGKLKESEKSLKEILEDMMEIK